MTVLKRNGFTLIEVMVAIAIIGVLAGIIYANFGDARSSANDDARKSSLKELQLAVELYRAQEGEFPVPDSSCPGNPSNGTDFYGPGPTSGSYRTCTDYIDGLVPDFISALPRAPQNEDETDLGFFYRSDGDSYKILVRGVESQTISDATDEFARCPTSGACGGSIPADEYAVYSIGAEDW